MPSITQLRTDVWTQLNENPDDPQHWKKDDLDVAIRLSLHALLSVTDIAFQETRSFTTAGQSKLFIADATRIIRVDGIEGVEVCPREMSVTEANDQNGICWRSCEYSEGDVADKFVLDPMQPQCVYFVAPPPPDTDVTISYIKVPTVEDNLVIPGHFYPILVDMVLGRAYQRETGGHLERSEAYMSASLSWVDAYYGQKKP